MVKQSALLRSESSSLLLEVVDGALVIGHWGALLVGEITDAVIARRVSIANSSWDQPQNPGIMRESARGFLGRPTLSGHRLGTAWSTKFEVTDFYHVDNHCTITLRDFHAELEILITFTMDTFGVVTQEATVKNKILELGSYNSLAGLGIRSLLICSFCSNQISHCERFAQIA